MSAGAPSTDLLQIDDQLTDEERLIRDTVRAFAGDRVLPHVEDWFEEGRCPATSCRSSASWGCSACT